MKSTVKASLTGFASIALLALTLPAHGAEPAMPITSATIDDTVARAMAGFEVPGVAVGIIKDGKLIFAKGYGVREKGKSAPVDADTLFQIGSNTKAFTAAAIAILVDEGKLHWEDKVIDHLPQFRMYDPYVTREFTIRDLLTHRSGLGLGAGDLMFNPTTDMSRAEIMHGLRYLKPVSSFRSKFDYDNLLYIVAGEVIATASGQSWEDFVQSRILGPLQMTGCAARYDRIKDRSNLASPHSVVEGNLRAIPVVDLNVVGAAGTINCNITGMAKWLETQLAAGRTPDGRTLFSPERGNEMWTVNTVLPIDPRLAKLNRTHFSGYGLGWFMEDRFGYQRVAHTGGVRGTVTWVAMVPELNLGVLVFTNQENGGAMDAIGNQILDAYLGAPKRDWVDIDIAYRKERADRAKAIEDQAAKGAATAGIPSLPLTAFAGDYVDSWRGAATVRLDDQRLSLKIDRTKDLEGTLTPYSGNIFIVRWNNRTLNADAFVRFEQGYDRKITGMTMQSISPATDFSFDFQDLDFKKVERAATSK